MHCLRVRAAGLAGANAAEQEVQELSERQMRPKPPRYRTALYREMACRWLLACLPCRTMGTMSTGRAR